MTTGEISSAFESDAEIGDRGTGEPSLVVDVEGFEGPLDLLLTLARNQKVDLSKISILALADQYLSFIEAARNMRIELAADYLVMAAWLAYLKSRLLLPDLAPEGAQSAEDMANALAYRLRRLEAFREVAKQLMDRPQLDRDIFGRGDPEPIAEIRQPEWTATLYDLLTSYSVQRQQKALGQVRFAKRNVWSLAEAREVLERLIGTADDWTRLDEYLIAYVVEPSLAKTVFASSFVSALELVREGQAELHQTQAFTPIYVRKRARNPGAALPNYGGNHETQTDETTKGATRMPRAAKKFVVIENEQETQEASEPAVDHSVTEPTNDDTSASAAQPAQRPEELRLIEALLFASKDPLDEATLAKRLPQGADVKQAMQMLQAEYASRGVNLVKIGKKWAFRTAGDLSWLLTKNVVQSRKLSRAAIETLAIIAYHQPVTRAEVEEIRGVVAAKGTLDVLLETGWIRPRGRRKVPGRPITYGTSDAFLSHFGLEAVDSLPGLDELKGAGLLDGRLPPGFVVPVPSDDTTLRDDEDPLEPGDLLDLGLAPPPERIDDK